MNVRELREALASYPDDAEVRLVWPARDSGGLSSSLPVGTITTVFDMDNRRGFVALQPLGVHLLRPPGIP